MYAFCQAQVFKFYWNKILNYIRKISKTKLEYIHEKKITLILILF